jgi:hypothetical protein
MVRNCLLPFLFWPWLIASVFGVVLFTAGIFDLPFYYQYVPDIPIPSWGRPAYALVSLAYFVSLLGMMGEKRWGLPLFVAATVAVAGIQLRTGLPVGDSLQVLISVVLFVIVLGLDEWQVQPEVKLESMHAAGLAKEFRRPAEALEIYKMVEENNATRSLAVLFAGVISLPAAYLVSFLVDQRLEQFQVPVAIGIMCVLGMGPVVFLSSRRFQEKNRPLRKPSRKLWDDDPVGFTWFANIWIWGWMLIIALFADAIQMVFMALIAGLILAAFFLPFSLWNWLAGGQPFVIGFPVETAPWINYGLSILVFGIVFIVVASDIRLKPFSPGRLLKDIPAGLMLNGEKIFSFLTNISLTAVLFGFVGARYDLLYSDMRIGVILYAFLGALIGWDQYTEEKDVLLGALNAYAQARCLWRTGKKTVARVFLYRALEGMDRLPPPYRQMGQALNLHFLEDLIPEIPRRELRKGEKELNEYDTPYYECCRQGIELTKMVLAP